MRNTQTLSSLKKKEADELKRQDTFYLRDAHKHLCQAWESLSAYHLRHPLPPNTISDLSSAQYDIEQAIGHMDASAQAREALAQPEEE